MKEILYAVLAVGGLGLVFGCLLAFAHGVFYVKEDERIGKISEVLPGANCGACGYSGCSAYASAVVNSAAPTNACVVGKDAVSSQIADIMGVNAEKTEAIVAHVSCQGNCENAPKKYNYSGVTDCISASRLFGGDKVCSYGCLGMGTCVSVCDFGAVSVKNGVAVVDPEKCGGCGKCAKACPKNVISMVPANSLIFVNCSNKDKGAVANKACKASCIGCKLCEKNCPQDAIHVTDNLARIDYEKCTGCGTCAEKCPRGAIVL